MAIEKPEAIYIKASINANGTLELAESSLELKLKEKEIFLSRADRIVFRDADYIKRTDIDGYSNDVAEIGDNGVPYRRISYREVSKR